MDKLSGDNPKPERSQEEIFYQNIQRNFGITKDELVAFHVLLPKIGVKDKKIIDTLMFALNTGATMDTFEKRSFETYEILQSDNALEHIFNIFAEENDPALQAFSSLIILNEMRRSQYDDLKRFLKYSANYAAKIDALSDVRKKIQAYIDNDEPEDLLASRVNKYTGKSVADIEKLDFKYLKVSEKARKIYDATMGFFSVDDDIDDTLFSTILLFSCYRLSVSGQIPDLEKHLGISFSRIKTIGEIIETNFRYYLPRYMQEHNINATNSFFPIIEVIWQGMNQRLVPSNFDILLKSFINPPLSKNTFYQLMNLYTNRFYKDSEKAIEKTDGLLSTLFGYPVSIYKRFVYQSKDKNDQIIENIAYKLPPRSDKTFFLEDELLDDAKKHPQVIPCNDGLINTIVIGAFENPEVIDIIVILEDGEQFGLQIVNNGTIYGLPIHIANIAAVGVNVLTIIKNFYVSQGKILSTMQGSAATEVNYEKNDGTQKTDETDVISLLTKRYQQRREGVIPLEHKVNEQSDLEQMQQLQREGLTIHMSDLITIPSSIDRSSIIQGIEAEIAQGRYGERLHFPGVKLRKIVVGKHRVIIQVYGKQHRADVVMIMQRKDEYVSLRNILPSLKKRAEEMNQ